MTESEINEHLNQYRASIQNDNYRSAIYHLAILLYCMPYLELQEQGRLERQLKQIEITDDLIKAAKEEIEKLAASINQIISIGSKWNEDEIMILLQRRIDIDVLLYFLEKYGEESQTDLSQIDELFDMIAVSPQNRRNFEIAIRQMKRNSDTQCYTKWLDVDNFKKNNH